MSEDNTQERKLHPLTPKILPIALLCAFLAIAYFALIHKADYPHGEKKAENTSRTAAPPLNLLLVTPGMQQKRFDLKSMRGQRVLVNYFASWCVPCVAELPELRKIARQNSLAIVGVAYNDNINAVLDFFAKYGSAYARVVLDPMGHAAIDWGLRGVPESYLIDENGNLLVHYPGPLTDAVWAAYFARYLPPPTP